MSDVTRSAVRLVGLQCARLGDVREWPKRTRNRAKSASDCQAEHQILARQPEDLYASRRSMSGARRKPGSPRQLPMFDGTRILPGHEVPRPSIAKTSFDRSSAQGAEEACTTSRNQIESLSAQLASLSSSNRSCTNSIPSTTDVLRSTYSPEQKLEIFRGIFRGREDVYPVRFESGKTGNSGYAPECANKFVRPLCDIERVKCRACRNRVYRPVTDDAILEHLKGRHVMGLYPLLPDDTCWFFAIDFDEKHWQRDIGAVRDTCRNFGIPVYVERSRSGNGGHVWFFFDEAIPANEARKLGTYILTETMRQYPHLSFSSYDRFFPSQDTMPKGGLGNLIALPLNGASRAKGNSVFVDDEFNAYAGDEQWRILSEVARISRTQIETIASQSTERLLDLELMHEDDDEEARSPWTRSPSGKPRSLTLAAPLPSGIRAVLAQRLFVESKDLPPALINRIRRLAAFQNPEFYKRQSLRLPVARTPRIIYLAEDTEHHVALPRGCVSQLAELASEVRIPFDLDDKRHEGTPLDVSFCGSLTDLQTQALESLAREDIGVLVAPPGIGKTVIGTALIAKRARNTLILVHRRPLQDQWRQQLARFLGMDPREIGEIRGQKSSQTGRIDVAMLQSLFSGRVVKDLVAQYGHIVVDECHHVPAVSFERVLSAIPARYVTGLTATPHRQDGHDPIIRLQLGPTRFKIGVKSQIAAQPFRHVLIVRSTDFVTASDDSGRNITELYSELAKDARRNELILDDVIATIREGRSPLVLTERKEHVEFLAERLERYARNLFVLTGGTPEKARRDLVTRMSELPANEPRTIVATGKFVGEGFDDAKLDTLFLTLPVSWKGVVDQYVGRLHRIHAGKIEVRIFDYVDQRVPRLARMFDKRLKRYRSLGYVLGELPNEFELCADPDIEAELADMLPDFGESCDD